MQLVSLYHCLCMYANKFVNTFMKLNYYGMFQLVRAAVVTDQVTTVSHSFEGQEFRRLVCPLSQCWLKDIYLPCYCAFTWPCLCHWCLLNWGFTLMTSLALIASLKNLFPDNYIKVKDFSVEILEECNLVLNRTKDTLNLDSAQFFFKKIVLIQSPISNDNLF